MSEPITSARTFRLPEGWSAIEAVEDVIDADGVSIHRAGLSSSAPSGEEVCGSAADRAGPAIDRAWFELLERVSLSEAITKPRDEYVVRSGDGRTSVVGFDVAFPSSPAPAQWRYARSNGVALHVDGETAARRALWELAERDRILRSWYGAIRPVELGSELSGGLFPQTASYEWRACSFPATGGGDFSRAVEVVGVFGFPARPDLPFVQGFAGRPTLRDAMEAAAREAVQVLAFLWGEAPTEDDVVPTPDAMGHLETFQRRGHHVAVRRWLDGGHAHFAAPAAHESRSPDVGFIDLTPTWAPPSVRVVKAVCAAAVPLTFGHSPFAAHLPVELRVHPIA